jgi:hypothetical protein
MLTDLPTHIPDMSCAKFLIQKGDDIYISICGGRGGLFLMALEGFAGDLLDGVKE